MSNRKEASEPRMLTFSKICVAVALMCACVTALEATEFQARFSEFKQLYGKSYATSAEHDKRYNIFATNMIVAEGLKARNPFATFGVNEFSDLSAEEFKTRHNAEKAFASTTKRNLVPKEQIATLAAGSKIDWRTKGAVTAVKNQGQCGSCFSFSISGNIEGQWFLAGNPLVSLSEQEQVSCDTTQQDGGCQGGLPDTGFEWLVSAHQGALVTEASYPYVSGAGVVPKCNMANTKFGARINGHHDIPSDEDSMAAWLYVHGPVSIGVDGTSFQSYTGGILTNCILQQLDHAVLLVGFDDTYNPPYWIIKNSWGPSWGEAGYIRVEKGTNQCGLNESPSTSVVGGPTTPPSPSSSGSAASSSAVPASSSSGL